MCWLRKLTRLKFNEGLSNKPGRSSRERLPCKVVSFPSRGEFRQRRDNSSEGFLSWDVVRRDDLEGLLGCRGPGILGVGKFSDTRIGEQKGGSLWPGWAWMGTLQSRAFRVWGTENLLSALTPIAQPPTTLPQLLPAKILSFFRFLLSCSKPCPAG